MTTQDVFRRFLTDTDRNRRVLQDVAGLEERIRALGQEPLVLPPNSTPDDIYFERTRQLIAIDPVIQQQSAQQFRQVAFGLNPLAASIGQIATNPSQSLEPQISPTLLPDNTVGETVTQLTSPVDVVATLGTAGLGPGIAGILGRLGSAGRLAGGLARPVLEGSLPARIAAETAVNAAGTGAAIETGRRLPEDTSTPVRLAATLGAGVLAGGGTAGAIGAGRAAARSVGEQGLARTIDRVSPVGFAEAAYYDPTAPTGATRRRSIDELVEAGGGVDTSTFEFNAMDRADLPARGPATRERLELLRQGAEFNLSSGEPITLPNGHTMRGAVGDAALARRLANTLVRSNDEGFTPEVLGDLSERAIEIVQGFVPATRGESAGAVAQKLRDASERITRRAQETLREIEDIELRAKEAAIQRGIEKIGLEEQIVNRPPGGGQTPDDPLKALEAEVSAARQKLDTEVTAQFPGAPTEARSALTNDLAKAAEVRDYPRHPITDVEVVNAELGAQKLTNFLRDAPRLLSRTRAAQSAERSQRFGQFTSSLARGDDPQLAFFDAQKPLAGKLPRESFEAIGTVLEDSGKIVPANSLIDPAEIDGMFRTIQAKQDFLPGEQLSAFDGLRSVLLGELPPRHEIALLERAFGPELSQAILSRRPLRQRVLEEMVDLANLPRTLMTILDHSALLRQGAVLFAGRPITSMKAIPASTKAIFKPGVARAVDAQIKSHPNFGRFTTSANGGKRLYIAPFEHSAALTQFEESFVSRTAQKIPGIKHLVGASERGFNTYLNKVRFDVMNNIVTGWERQVDAVTGLPLKAATEEELDTLARHINYATGRGNLGPLEPVAPQISAVVFAPRWLFSRVQLPLPLLDAAIQQNPRLLKETARDLVAFVSSGITIGALINYMKTGDVETDARSSDFGKARIDKVRYDYWASYQPLARYTWQIATNEVKRPTTGKIRNQAGDELIWRFIRSKLAPAPGVVVDLAARKNFIGEPVVPDDETGANEIAIRELKNRITPLFIQDMLEVIEEEGVISGIPKGAPGIVGVGVQAFDAPDTIRERPN